MEHLKIIVIEDEKPAARRLVRLLDKMNLIPQIVLHTVGLSVKWLKENTNPDLIFLDIQLSDGLSFEIFDQVKVTSSIIFTTAYDEYALRAFKLKSIDYLLKPIDEKELKIAIEKYKSYTDNKQTVFSEEQLQVIQQLISGQQTLYKERFSVKIGQHLRTVNTQEIECFYSEEKATYLASTDGKNINIDYSLEQLEDLLDSKQFYRVNRKYIINVSAIKDMLAYSNSRLKIKLKHFSYDEIIVSRERVKAFKKWLG